MSDAISDFWSFWASAGPRIAKAIESRDFGSLTDEIGLRVRAISDAITWELGPGQTKPHAFCLSSNGNPILRRLTERWASRAPTADPTWEFYAARPGGGDGWQHMVMQLGPVKLAFGGFVCTFEVDMSRERVDATFFHPAFAQADEQARSTATLLMLDRAFGEDGVERWIGAIDVLTAPPDGARPVTELAAAVQQLASQATGEKFAILRGQFEGAPIFITKNMALKRIDHLDMEMHVAIDIPLRDPTADGLTTRAEAEILSAMEDELLGDLGDAAVYLARETFGGKRVIHLFAQEGGRAGDVVSAWTKRQKRTIDVAWKRDPKWEVLHKWG